MLFLYGCAPKRHEGQISSVEHWAFVDVFFSGERRGSRLRTFVDRRGASLFGFPAPCMHLVALTSSLLRPLAGNFLIGEARFTPCRGELSGGAEMLVVDGKTQNEKWPRTKFPSHPRMDRIRDIHTASLNAKPFQGAG